MNNEIIDQVTSACTRIFFDKKNYQLPEEFNYAHLPLCVMDSVFSIGVKYESATNAINRFCIHFNIDKFSKNKEHSTTDFLQLMENVPLIELTEKIYCNRQRTSTKNGILKSEAVIKFLKLLQKYRIEYISDINNLIVNDNLENEIKKIPGQASGISYKYFLMLTGSDDLVKPDRMILRFLDSITNHRISLDDCQIIFQEVVKQMNKTGFNLTPKKLDSLIWNYQRSIK